MIVVMFTGIVERTVRVARLSDEPSLRRIDLDNPWTDLRPGESVAVNGVCLTVARLNGSTAGFDVIAETLDKTNLGAVRTGAQVNVERSLRAGDRIDGHFVQGHVDGTGTVLAVRADGADRRLTIAAPVGIAKYLVTKGSVCVDGVSLTIARLAGREFDVALIPTTLQLTTLGSTKVGDRVNLEADMFAKTIVGFLETQQPTVDR